jgi:hypothetical protein
MSVIAMIVIAPESPVTYIGVILLAVAVAFRLRRPTNAGDAVTLAVLSLGSLLFARPLFVLGKQFGPAWVKVLLTDSWTQPSLAGILVAVGWAGWAVLNRSAERASGQDVWSLWKAAKEGKAPPLRSKK